MSDNKDDADTAGQRPSRADRVAHARRQLAAATTEFQKAVAAVRDPERRRELTDSYIQLLQKSLASAQQTLDRYERRRSGRHPTNTDTSEPTPPPQA